MYVNYSHPTCGIDLCHTTKHTTQIPLSHIPLPPSTHLDPQKILRRVIHRLDWSQQRAARLCRHRPGHPEPGVLSIPVRVNGGMALPRVLWNKREGVKILWQLIVCDKLWPRGGRPEHLLWMLYFLKVYPKQGPGCLVVSASAVAIDLKTHCKYGSETTSRPLPSWLMSWWVYLQCEDSTDCCIFCDDSLWFIWQCLCWQVLGNPKKMG